MTTIERPPETAYDELVGLWRARCPQLDSFMAREFRMPNLWRGVHVRAAVDDGRYVGWGFCGVPSYAPGPWWYVQVVVPHEVERRGVGSVLHRALQALAPPTTTRLMGEVFDTDERALAVVTHWGYRQYQHAVNYRLDLVDLPAPDLPADVTIDDVPRLDVPDAEAVDAMLLASQTNPEEPSDLAEHRRLADGFEVPTGHVLRVDGRPAGLCQGEVSDGVLQLIYTGIDPAHRGRGLARLLKQHAHLYGAALGATTCDTNNEAANTGIRHVNESLGYRRVSGRRRVAIDLDGSVS